MFTAILWDYDGTLANTPVKNIAVTRAVLGRLDPALLDPLPDAISSLAAYQAANYRWRNWRELYQHALRVPADRLDEAGALWGPCQLADRTLPPLFGGLLEVLPRLAALAPMGICSQNDSGNIRAALAAHGAADCFAAVVGHADVDFARQKPDPAAFLACLDRLGLREGRFAYIGDHAGDIAFGRNAQAALRAMGCTRRRVTGMFSCQQGLLCLLGILLGLVALGALRGGMEGVWKGKTLLCAGLYFLGATIGAMVTSTGLGRRKPMELLQIKE